MGVLSALFGTDGNTPDCRVTKCFYPYFLPPVFLREVYDCDNRDNHGYKEQHYKGSQIVGFDLEIGVYHHHQKKDQPNICDAIDVNNQFG